MSAAKQTHHLGLILENLLRDAHHLTAALPEASRRYRHDLPTTNTDTTGGSHTPPGPKPPPGAFTPGPHQHAEQALKEALRAASFARDAIAALHRIGDPDLYQPPPKTCANCRRPLRLLDTHTECGSCRSAKRTRTRSAK
jgi:hypothetical protein